MGGLKMDKKEYYVKLIIWEVIGVFVIFILGSIWHNLYKNTGYPIIGFIAPVNESSWEHLKIFFFPWLLYGAIEYYFVKDKVNSYVFSKTLGLLIFELLALSLIAIYDQYTGTHNLIATLIFYFLGIAVGTYVSYTLMSTMEENKFLNRLGWIILLVQLVLILWFTVNPPRADYFKDSVTGTYGIYKYPE